MRLTKEQKRYARTIQWLLLAAFIVSPLYTILVDGFGSWIPFINGAILAPSIVLIFGFFEFVVFSGKVRKKSFHVLLTLRISAYFISITLCVLLVMILSRMFRFDISFQGVLESEEFKYYLNYGDFKALIMYIFVIVLLANFVLQMDRKMGQGVLKGFLTGRFSSPKEINVFILFLKLQHASDYIKVLGDQKFLQFFNEVIFDITNTIIFNKGNISSYDDDEILIIWEPKEGILDAQVMRTYFEIHEDIDLHKIRYFEKYGAVPRFTGAVHYGEVICGEIGEVKSEIRYSGETMNTAHRILELACREETLVISEAALELLRLPVVFESYSLGENELRGRDRPVRLFGVKAKTETL